MKQSSPQPLPLLAIGFIAAFCTTLISCAPKLYNPSDQDAVWVSNFSNTEVVVSDLSAGKTMYPLYCATCHDLHMPPEYTIAEWQNIYPNMAEKVSLADTSEQKILLYLLAGAKDAGK